MRILITAELPPDVLERLRAAGHELRLDTTWAEQRHILSEEDMVRLASPGFDIIIAEMEPVSKRVIEAAGAGLRLIGAARADPVNVDMALARTRNILVLHTPARNARPVAELTLGLMIVLARRILPADQFIRQGRWRADHRWGPHRLFEGPGLAGMTLGLVGYGSVGRQVARRAQAFDMHILVYDPYVRSVEPYVSLVSLEELLRRSDFVSLHAAVTSETTGLINASALQLMKPSAYLINTARAALVDEQALYQTLVEKRIAGAALDVYWQEPPPPDSRWFALNNVVLTPHLGGATPETPRNHATMLVEDIERFLKGERPLHLANPEVWDQLHPQGS